MGAVQFITIMATGIRYFSLHFGTLLNSNWKMSGTLQGYANSNVALGNASESWKISRHSRSWISGSNEFSRKVGR